MNFEKSEFWKMQSINELKKILYLKRHVYCEEKFVNSKISVYVKNNRIIESPDADIKAIQKNILRKLVSIGLPEYVFSGIKGKSYADMIEKHREFDCTYRLDISKFFYNTSREKVYNFFIDKLKVSNDIAQILTIYSTIDIDLKKLSEANKVKKIINNYVLKSKHLIAGAPQSPLLSFFVNQQMFDEVKKIADENNILFTLYFDDLMFSSNTQISDVFKESVKSILKQYSFTAREK